MLSDEVAQSVLCVPVVTPDGDCFAVFELVKSEYDEPFNMDDLKIVVVLTGWMGAAIHQNLQRIAMKKQEILHDHLLDITKSYYNGSTTTCKMLTDLIVSLYISISKDCYCTFQSSMKSCVPCSSE